MDTLPDELLSLILVYLPVRDALSVASTCKRLHAVATSHYVQSRLDFLPERVRSGRFQAFARAARCGNFVAAMKLGVSSLYAEGVEIDAKLAADMLLQADTLAKNTSFAWALVRPPWSTNTCTKAQVFNRLKQHVDANPSASPQLVYSVGKVFRCCPEDEMFDQGRVYIERAAAAGCEEALAELHSIAVEEEDEPLRVATAHQLQAAAPRANHAVLRTLTQDLVKRGAADRTTLARCFHLLLQQSTANQPRRVDLGGSMRYVLFDWLVEVSNIKQYEQRTFLLACRLVDLYTQHLPISRGRYQLLGIAAMVVAARFYELDVITVREAAWLTDNTYTYEEVVRTMADLLAVGRSELKVMTHVDILERFMDISPLTPRQRNYMMFIAELAVLHIHTSMFSPCLLAAAVFMLVSLAEDLPRCWPAALQQLTGLRASDPRLHACVRHLYERVWEHDLNSPSRVRDSRGAVLRTVESRYWHAGTGMHAPAAWLPTADTLADTLQTLRASSDGTPRKRQPMERSGSARMLTDLSNCSPMAL